MANAAPQIQKAVKLPPNKNAQREHMDWRTRVDNTTTQHERYTATLIKENVNGLVLSIVAHLEDICEAPEDYGILCRKIRKKFGSQQIGRKQSG